MCIVSTPRLGGSGAWKGQMRVLDALELGL